MSDKEARAPSRLVLKWDYRGGGIPVARLMREGERLMYAPDAACESVVFLAAETQRGLEWAGTAFFFGVPYERGDKKLRHTYLVTARHCLSDIKENSIDDLVHIRYNTKSGGFAWTITELSHWERHPAAPKDPKPHCANVDIAVLPIPDGFPDLRMSYVPMHWAVTEQLIKTFGIGRGVDIRYPSLFLQYHGDTQNVPLLRGGHIAAMPAQPVNTDKDGLLDVYFVEARSIAGISGAPVFVPRPYGFIPDGKTNAPIGLDTFFLLGVMHGHWRWIPPNAPPYVLANPAWEPLNTGIALVSPAIKLLETINQEKLMHARQEQEEQRKRDQSPVADSATEGMTKEGFERALRKAARPIEQEPDDQSDPESSGT